MPPFVLRPNISITFTKNLIIIVSGMICIISFALIIKNSISFEMFSAFGLSSDGLVTTSANFFWYFLSGIAILGSFFLILNYITLNNLRYEFHSDLLEIFTTKFLILHNREEWSYNNIVSASYTQKFFDKLFNLGTIIISLRGTDKQNINLELIENVSYYTNLINKQLDTYRSAMQLQMQNQLKIGEILKREAY